MNGRSELVQTLNALIGVCAHDADKLRTAAEFSQDLDQQRLIHKVAEQRDRFVNDLSLRVKEMGAHSKGKRTWSAFWTKAWLKVKFLFFRQKQDVVVAECEKSEEVTLQKYEKALGKPMPPPIESMVRNQYSEIKTSHQIIRDVENQIKHPVAVGNIEID